MIAFRRIRNFWMGAALFFLVSPFAAISAEWDLDKQPWEKFGANFGIFLSAFDSDIRLGSGLGLSIDVEDLLGLNTSNAVFRADALWRFSKNRRHRINVSWFSLKRDGSRRLLEDITIKDDNDKEIIIPAGTDIEAFFDLDIYEIAYSYSFIQDDRLDMAVGAGLYVMPLDFGIKATGFIQDEGSARFTAPLPVVGLRMDIAIAPNWFVRTGSQVFYLEYENFKGAILDFRAAVEYNPWKHVGIGLGFDALAVKVEANGEDYPEIDFKGSVEFNYTGLQLYLRYFF